MKFNHISSLNKKYLCNLPLVLLINLLVLVTESNAVTSEHILTRLDNLKGQDILKEIEGEEFVSSYWGRDCDVVYLGMLKNIDKRSTKTNKHHIKAYTDTIDRQNKKLKSLECGGAPEFAAYTSDVATIILKLLITDKVIRNDGSGFHESSQEFINQPKRIPALYKTINRATFAVYANNSKYVSYQCAKTINTELPNPA